MEAQDVEALNKEMGVEFSELDEERDWSLVENKHTGASRWLVKWRKVVRHDPTGVHVAISYATGGEDADEYEASWVFVFPVQVTVTKYLSRNLPLEDWPEATCKAHFASSLVSSEGVELGVVWRSGRMSLPWTWKGTGCGEGWTATEGEARAALIRFVRDDTAPGGLAEHLQGAAP
jgi:hypothetical protein